MFGVLRVAPQGQRPFFTWDLHILGQNDPDFSTFGRYVIYVLTTETLCDLCFDN
jgi:hypothetical protein